MEDRFRPLVNRGEGAVLDIARDVCKATGTEAFTKIRIADAICKRPASFFSLDTHIEKWVIDFVGVLFVVGQKSIHTKKLPDEETYCSVFEHFGVEMGFLHPDHWQFEEVTDRFFQSIIPGIMTAAIKFNRDVCLVVLRNKDVEVSRKRISVKSVGDAGAVDPYSVSNSYLRECLSSSGFANISGDVEHGALATIDKWSESVLHSFASSH